jgi:hypothetical protein
MTISSLTARTSAVYLSLVGATFLFAADKMLPLIIPAFPRSGLFLGQLLGAAWLAMAALNWNHRAQMLGGIYSRPMVFANALMFTISALGVLSAATAPGASPWLWAIVIPCAVFAVVFFAMMLRGPFDSLRT